MADSYSSRRGMTFSQAEGLVALPQQLQLGQLDQRARNKIWTVFLALLELNLDRRQFPYLIGTPMRSVLQYYWVNYLGEPIDELSLVSTKATVWIKSLVFESDYNVVLDLFQLTLQRLGNLPTWRTALSSALEEGGTAYRVVDDDLVAPISNEMDAAAINQAFDALSSTNFAGARSHLRQAAQELSSRDWGRAVAESMNAVESVVRIITETGTLSDAIKKLERAGAIHGGLRSGLEKIYGYTSDEQGVRHSLLEQGGVKVDETDALFMFGACAAFITYIIGKGRQARLIKI